MKIYVASKFENYEAVRDVIEVIRDAGHEITHDWTRTEEMDPVTGELGEANAGSAEVQRKSASLDLLGVRRADALLVLGFPGMCGGMVEYGAALALGKRIAVVEPMRCYTIFYLLDGVTMHDSVPEALAALGLVGV